jgi:hypothetical protein
VQSGPGRHPVVEILCRSSRAAIARSAKASAAAVIIQQGVNGFEGDGAGNPFGVALRQIVKSRPIRHPAETPHLSLLRVADIVIWLRNSWGRSYLLAPSPRCPGSGAMDAVPCTPALTLVRRSKPQHANGSRPRAPPRNLRRDIHRSDNTKHLGQISALRDRFGG